MPGPISDAVDRAIAADDKAFDVEVETDETHEIAPIAPHALALADMSPADFQLAVASAKTARERLQTVQREVLQRGVDYGVIPGTGKKPTLLKPGAETLNRMAGFTHSYHHDVRYGDGETSPPLTVISYCTLTDARTGASWAASGMCNSWETKYRYRRAQKSCPTCGSETIISGKPEYNKGIPNWVCFKKKGGCGANFAIDDERITSQAEGNVDNPDPYDLGNTILKMADKRAYLAVTLNAHAASGLFTQDLDERQSGPSAPTPQPPDDIDQYAPPIDTPPPASSASPRGIVPTLEDFYAARDKGDLPMWAGEKIDPSGKHPIFGSSKWRDFPLVANTAIRREIYKLLAIHEQAVGGSEWELLNKWHKKAATMKAVRDHDKRRAKEREKDAPSEA